MPKISRAVVVAAFDFISALLKIWFLVFVSSLIPIRELNVSVFPRNRNRYLKFLQFFEANSLTIRSLRPEILSGISKLNKLRLIISSDFLLEVNSRSKKYLKEIEFKAFIWNDELEVSQLLANLQLENLDCITFFSDLGASFNGQITTEIPNFRITGSGKLANLSETVLFAGQVDTHHFDEMINSSEKLRRISHKIIAETVSKSPIIFFDKYNPDFLKLTLDEFVAVRHKAMNVWREEVLTELSLKLGKKLHLIGNHFVNNPRYANSVVLKNVKQLDKKYSQSRFNLELGSQCGPDYLYPRSLEIYSRNEDSLLIFYRGDLKNKLKGYYWNNTEDLVKYLEKELT